MFLFVDCFFIFFIFFIFYFILYIYIKIYFLLIVALILPSTNTATWSPIPGMT